jgi:hypothetical protein
MHFSLYFRQAMDLITKLRYQGYAATPPLWKGSSISQFKQIEIAHNVEIIENSIVFKNQRLGKLVEEFVFYQLQQLDAVTWICDTLQIQNGKRTVGEIDALYIDEGRPIHLEIVYKFYLYDSLENYNQPLAYWIGPNRKDSLLYKLDKLHSKQFPILYSEFTKTSLDTYNLDLKNIEQRLCFKAQLFLPYDGGEINLSPLNAICIAGFYIAFNKIEVFKNLKFYIPNKLDWLILPHQNVQWLDYATAIPCIKNEINKERSPLIWLKSKTEIPDKCFITFW